MTGLPVKIYGSRRRRQSIGKTQRGIGNNVEAQGEGSIALGTGYEEINGGTPTITQTVAASGYKYNMPLVQEHSRKGIILLPWVPVPSPP